MVKKSFKIFIICLILLMTVGMVSAAEDADDSNSTDTLSVSEDIKTDDILEVSEDEDVLGDEVGSFSELQTEIDNAAEGSVIYLEKDYKRNSYSQSGMTINKQLTIDGKGHSLDGESSGRIFNIYSGNVILKNITFKNAKPGSGSGGAVYASSDMITIDSCNFEYNTVSDTSSATGNYKQEFGGSIYLDGNNNCIKNCNFTNKNWDDVTSSNVTLCNVLEGGEIYLNGANNLIEACHFLNSYAWESGGAIYCNGNNNTISGSEFINSTVTSYALHRYYNSGRYYYYDSGEGGAVFFKGNDNKVLNSNFTGFFTLRDGMCLYFYGSDNLVNNSRFEDANYDLPNSCSEYDWLYCYSTLYFSNLNNVVVNSNFTRLDSTHILYFNNEYDTVDNCIFNDSLKGCIYSYKDNILINNSKFLNSKSGYCVGLNGGNTNCVIDNSLFDNNSGYSKVALYGSNINIYNCNFTNNKAEDSGIISVSESMLYNCKFINNSVNTFGGAIISEGGITIDSCDFDNNSAVGGGAIYVWGNDCRIYNSNFANNKAYNARDIDNFNPTGGAVFISGNGIVIENITCINNFAVAGDNGISNGGAIAVVVCNNVNIHNVNFTNNSAYKGGAIYQLCCDADISNCNFINDSATYGSEIYLNNVANTISIESDTETDNTNLIFSEEFTGENNCVLENSTIFLVKSNIEIKLGLNEKLNIVGQLTFKDESIKGVYVNQSTFEYNNISYNDSGKIISADHAFANQSVNVEIYDDNDELIVNGTYKTDDNGVFEIDAYDLVSRGAIKYTKAYRLEDNSYFYGENNYNIPQLGDFTILQSLINQVEENGTLVLDRNYTYDLISDTITDGIVIDRNITIIGNGYTINALNQSRIFNISADNTVLSNINFVNAVKNVILYNNVSNAVIENSTFANTLVNDGVISFTGEDLTLTNCEFVNSSVKVQYHIETDFETGNSKIVADSIGESLLYVNSTGKINISKSKFRNSKFNNCGIKIESADSVSIENNLFENNMGFEYLGDYDDTGEIIIYENYDVFPGILIYINSSDVKLSDSDFTNNNASKLVEIDNAKLDVADVTVSDSYLEKVFCLNNVGNTDISNLTIDNILTSQDIYLQSRGNLTLKDIEVKNSKTLNNGNTLIYIETAGNITSNDLSFENISPMLISEYSIDEKYGILYQNFTSKYGFGMIMDSAKGNIELYNTSFNNIKSGSEDVFLKISAKNVTIENYTLKNSSAGGKAETISVNANENIYLNNWIIDDISKCEGINETYFDYDYKKYVYDYYEEDGAFSIMLCAENNTTLTNINITNSVSGYQAGLMDISSGNLTFNNILVENVTTSMVTNIRWDSDLNMEKYDIKTSEYSNGFIISASGLADISNFTIINVTNAGTDMFWQVSSKDIVLQDILINNSALSGGEGYPIEFTASNNLTLNNFVVNNITQSPGENHTYYDNSYAKYIYSYEQEGEEGGFGIIMEVGNNTVLTNMSLTNIIGGGYEGILNVGSKNIIADNILVENVTVVNYTVIEYNPYIADYVYEKSIGECCSNGLKFNGQGIVNVTNIKINNTESTGENTFFEVEGGNVTLENISLLNSKITGEEGEGIMIYASNNAIVKNFVMDNLSRSLGENETSYDSEYGKYIWSYESMAEGGCVGIHIDAGDNATVQDLSITNIDDAGYEILSVSASDVIVDNVVLENITSGKNINYEYNPYLDEYTYSIQSKDAECRIEINGNNNVVFSNIKIANYTTSEGFLSVEGGNITIENMSIVDSAISGGEVGAEIYAENYINVKNIYVDNISKGPGSNSTEYSMQCKKYIWEYEDSYGGISFLFKSEKNITASNISIINVDGGAYQGILSFESANITLDGVLIENITSSNLVDIEYDYNLARYVVMSNETASDSGCGLYVKGEGGISNLSNIVINNIVANGEESYALVISSNNIIIENITLSNVTAGGEYSSQFESSVNKYDVSIDMDELEIGYIEGGNISIKNMLVDNLPTSVESFYISGENVTIDNSTFKNMVSGAQSYQTNPYTHELILVYDTNEARAISIYGDYVIISNTTFENITVGASKDDGGVLYIKSNNYTLVDNCTFKDIIIQDYYCYNYNMDNDESINKTGESYGVSVRVEGNSANINNSSFINCSSAYGGALYVFKYINITESEFINCSAKMGGAIYVNGSNLNLTGSYFEGNRAVDGGAIYFAISAYNNTVYNSTFSKNFAEHNGGALYIYETTYEGVNIINASTFLDNHANYNGGAYFFNDTINNMVWDDYRWDNATASTETHGAYTFISPNLHRTMIILSEFERNSDYSLNITAHNNAVGGNHTVTITIDEIAEGYIYVNITDKDGNYVKDKNGNEINGRYLLEDGKLLLELEDLEIGQYNVSAYYDGWDYELYPLYYHVNSTVFEVYPHDLNVTVTKSAYADENITVTAKLNNKTTGTVNITVSNGTFTKTYSDIPVVNGTVVYNVTGFYAGDYNITVTYNGDDIFYSKSNTTNFTVKQRKSVIDSVEVEDNVYGTTTKIIVKVPENQTGNVTVKINGENITKEVTDGEVTFEIENLTATEWEAEITFNENRVYDENSTAFRFNVTKADLTCEVEAANVTVKDNGSFTITVPKDFKGNVTIKIKGTEYYNGPVSDIVNITALPAGNYTADVTFCGDKNYNDTTIKADFTVESVEPEMTVEITSPVYGNNATATVTVANMANGTVNITVDGKIYTGEVKNGTATVQLDNVSAGVKTAEAKFITADLYNSNTTAAATFTVTKANATLTITNHTRDVVINLPQDANGSVEIYVNGEKYIKEIKNGKATVENILKDGENSVVAIWVGDDNYNDASNSTRIGFDKDAGKKNATLTISNESRDVIVELPADAKGNLTVYINGDKYTPEIVNGKANISGKLIDGNNSVVVIWSGDTNYTSAVNSTKINIEKVTPPKTLPEIAISADDRDVIISLPENAEGNLTVYINGEKYTPEIQNGKANVTGILKDGNNTVVVIYSGDANYTDGVNATSIYIESPIKQNATIKITNQTADIVITFPEGASGNVTVYVNGKNYTAEIINGNATVKDVLVDGNNSVVVVWDGDDKYNRLSNSTVIELPVSEIPSKLFNITVTDLIAEGGKVIVNVTGEGEGSVNVTVDNGTVQSKALTNGEAVFDLTGLSTDRHEIVVTTPDGAVSKITIDAKANGVIEIATIKAENMTRGYGSPYDYQAAFLDAEGNALVNTVVTFKVNGKEYNATTNSDGIAQLTDAKLAVGKYNITSINTVTGESITRELEIVKRILENKDMTMDYTDGSVFKVKVIGDDGNIAPEGSIISITANGVSYVAKVDSKGYASLKINLLPKTYKVVCEFNGYKTTNKLVVKQILKPVKKTIKVKKSKKSFKIKATLKWSNKKPIKGKKITFKIKGKTLKAKTNKKGVATVKVKKSLMKKLKKGKTYTVKITYAVKVKYGDAYQTISDTVKCKVKVK